MGSYFRLAGLHLPVTDFSQLWKCSLVQSNFSSSFFFFICLILFPLTLSGSSASSSVLVEPWGMHLPSLLCSESGSRSHLTSVQSLLLPSLTLHQQSLQDPLALLEFQSPVCLRNALFLVTMHLLPCSSALLLDLLISILHLTCQTCSLLLVSLGLHFHFLFLKDILWVNKFLNYICKVILVFFFFFLTDQKFHQWLHFGNISEYLCHSWHAFWKDGSQGTERSDSQILWFLKPGSLSTDNDLPVIHQNQAVTVVWRFQMTVREFYVYILWKCIWTVVLLTLEISVETALIP